MSLTRGQGRILVCLAFLCAISLVTLALTNDGIRDTVLFQNASSEEAIDEPTTTTLGDPDSSTTTLESTDLGEGSTDGSGGGSDTELPVDPGDPLLTDGGTGGTDGTDGSGSGTTTDGSDPLVEGEDPPVEETTTTTEAPPPPTTTTTIPRYDHRVQINVEGDLNSRASVNLICENGEQWSWSASGGQVLDTQVWSSTHQFIDCFVNWFPHDGRVDFISDEIEVVTIEV